MTQTHHRHLNAEDLPALASLRDQYADQVDEIFKSRQQIEGGSIEDLLLGITSENRHNFIVTVPPALLRMIIVVGCIDSLLRIRGTEQ